MPPGAVDSKPWLPRVVGRKPSYVSDAVILDAIDGLFSAGFLNVNPLHADRHPYNPARSERHVEKLQKKMEKEGVLHHGTTEMACTKKMEDAGSMAKVLAGGSRIQAVARNHAAGAHSMTESEWEGVTKARRRG